MSILKRFHYFLFKDKRRKKFIDAVTQFQIAFEILIHSFLFLILIILVLYVNPMATMFSDYSLEAHQNALISLIEINSGKWLLFVLVALIVSYVSILFSHRICGPAYKLKMLISRYSERDLRMESYLRKNDYLSEVSEALSSLRDTMLEDAELFRRIIKEATSEIENINDDSLKNKLNSIIKEADGRLCEYKYQDQIQEKGEDSE